MGKHRHILNVRFILIAILMVVISSCGQQKPDKPEVQGPENRKSPIAIASINSNNTYVKVVYGQPYRRGRTIFGEWEPFGQVWRTGANEATEITFTNPVLMNKNMIEAGTYALFTIPDKDRWTIILNNALGQWGAFEYDEAFDYKRFNVPIIELSQPVETFSIAFDEVRNQATTLVISWDFVRVEIPIVFY